MEKKINLSKNELKVLQVLHRDAYDCEICLAFDWIEGETKLSKKEVQKACKVLREKELIEFHRGLMSDDGQVAGSGYCISYKGRAFLNPCDKCKEEAHYD